MIDCSIIYCSKHCGLATVKIEHRMVKWLMCFLVYLFTCASHIFLKLQFSMQEYDLFKASYIFVRLKQYNSSRLKACLTRLRLIWSFSSFRPKSIMKLILTGLVFKFSKSLTKQWLYVWKFCNALTLCLLFGESCLIKKHLWQLTNSS